MSKGYLCQLVMINIWTTRTFGERRPSPGTLVIWFLWNANLQLHILYISGCITNGGIVLSLLNLTIIYWILKMYGFIQHRQGQMLHLTMFVKEKIENCWFAPKLNGFFLGPCCTLPSRFMKIVSLGFAQ